MTTWVNGLHHVTALASDPQRNIDFYTGVLGLRLVKKTVNFDAPDVYHFYYGDQTGTPGTILTFFPYKGLVRGRKGTGQLTYTAFSIPQASLSGWMDRLSRFHIPFDQPQRRFHETYIRFEDYDGLGIELVAHDDDVRPGWDNGVIAPDSAIRGFHTVTLYEKQLEPTVELLTQTLQHRIIAEEGGRVRLAAGNGQSGNLVDIVYDATAVRGLPGAGTIHHVAFATDSDQTQQQLRAQLLAAQYAPTPVVDRTYFHSIYFREPGGVLFEVATLPPGFLTDETEQTLGQTLQLPAWYESQRAIIEKHLDYVQPMVWA